MMKSKKGMVARDVSYLAGNKYLITGIDTNYIPITSSGWTAIAIGFT